MSGLGWWLEWSWLRLTSCFGWQVPVYVSTFGRSHIPKVWLVYSKLYGFGCKSIWVWQLSTGRSRNSSGFFFILLIFRIRTVKGLMPCDINKVIQQRNLSWRLAVGRVNASWIAIRASSRKLSYSSSIGEAWNTCELVPWIPLTQFFPIWILSSWATSRWYK